MKREWGSPTINSKPLNLADDFCVDCTGVSAFFVISKNNQIKKGCLCKKIAQRRIKRMENKSKTIVLSLKYVLLAILTGVLVGIIDTVFGRGLLTISDFRTGHYLYLIPFLPFAGLLITWLSFGRWNLRPSTCDNTAPICTATPSRPALPPNKCVIQVPDMTRGINNNGISSLFFCPVSNTNVIPFKLVSLKW